MAEDEVRFVMQGSPKEHAIRMGIFDKYPAAVVKISEVVREHILFRLFWGKGTLEAGFCGLLRSEKQFEPVNAQEMNGDTTSPRLQTCQATLIQPSSAASALVSGSNISAPIARSCPS